MRKIYLLNNFEYKQKHIDRNSRLGITEKIRLFIKCRSLADLDVFSKTDPFCEVYLREDENEDWELLGKTEIQHNTLNPDFLVSLEIEYFFNKTQFIRFEVYDKDSKK